MFSAHTIHVLHVAVRDFFIVLFVLLSAGFFWLIHGITFEKLTFGSYEIDGLYIKLDKKLTLKATRVVIPEKKEKPSVKNLDRTFDRIKSLLTYFDTIYLEKVIFNNNHFTVYYAQDVLYLSSREYEVAGNITRHGNRLVADVPVLYLKEYNTTLSGKLSYNMTTHVLEAGGSFESFGIKGHFRVVKRRKRIVYALNSEPFGNLRPLIQRIGLPKAIMPWVVDRVQAGTYRLAYIKGSMPIGKHGIEPDFLAMKGKAYFKDVSIYFQKGLPPVKAKAMTLIYDKGNLSFSLKDARYKKRSVDGSSVVIRHVVGPLMPMLVLDLHVVSPLDAEVHRILDTYNIYLPLSHTGSHCSADITLKIPLSKKKKGVKAAVDVVMDKGTLSVGGMHFYVTGGEVYYTDKKAVLKNVDVKEPWFTGRINGNIDMQQQHAELMLDAVSAQLGEKNDPIFLLQHKRLPLQLFFGKEQRLVLPTLGVEAVQQKKRIDLYLNDMKKLLPYLRHNLLGLTGGKLKISTEDRVHYHFSGTIQKEICFFYEQNDQCYTRIPVEGDVDVKNNDIDLYAFGRRLHYNAKKSVVTLKGLNIDLKRFIEEQQRSQKRMPKSPLANKKIVILGKNSQLRYEKYRLVTDSYDIEVFPNGNIRAMGINDGDVVKFTKKGNIFFLQALRIKDKMLHPLINFSGLKHGRYSLKKEGDPSKKMKGRILIEGGVLSDFKAYSNTLAFINTIPALATLNKPGFSNEGFKIEEGVIDYTMTPEKIVFDSVYLKGNTATVVGKGEVLLKGTKKINVNLAIRTVREFGKVVGKIPLLGYILMGDDNSMTVGLKVGGTLDNPKVTTSVAKDILTLPLEILKRTITAPAHLGSTPMVAPDIPDAHKERKTIPSKTLPQTKTPQQKSKEHSTSPKPKQQQGKPITRYEVPSKDPSSQLF